MSIDGCTYAGLKSPLVSCLFHRKGLSSASLPLACANFTTAEFHQAVSFERHLYLRGLCIHAAILDLAVGSASYGTTLDLSVTPRKENHVVLRRRATCMQRVNSSETDVSSDLESQIVDFMDHSARPELFPSKSELLKAGRSDLVEAILARGGWMVAGWDLEPDTHEEDHSCDDLVINGILKAQTGNESVGEFQKSQPANLGDGLGLANKTEVSQSPQTFSSVERRRAWEKVATLFGLSNSSKEIQRSQPHVINGTSALTQPGFIQDKNGRMEILGPPVAGGSTGSGLTSKACESKKKRRRKRSKLLNRSSSAQKGWVAQTKGNDTISDGRKQNDESISLRIQGLESALVSFLDIMKSGKRSLNDDTKWKQADAVHKAELEEVSDALEFCETQIMNKKRELRTAQAQRTAIEGKLALDLMEFERSMEDKDKHFEQAMEVLKTLRTARIIWPNSGWEVFLAGSYDGWASWKRMEKSSAGVFVTTLQLYPGQYEIKFIVDGVWSADPNRPRTWAGGYENNVLTVV